MSTFKVKVYEIKIKPHPNADLIELGCIGDFRSIVRKGQYKDGDLVAYIPEASLVPEEIIAELELTGKLSGPNKNRVKAIRLRGELSQGLIYPARPHWNIGDDVQEELGITKFEPPIPNTFRGYGINIGHENTVKYDIENFKYYPELFNKDEEVIITEKLHGTNCQMILLPEPNWKCNKDFFVASKGLGANGFVFETDLESNKGNAYCKIANDFKIEEKMKNSSTVKKFQENNKPVILMGEIIGSSIQDLSYGTTMTFRVFDCYVGTRSNGAFMDFDDLQALCKELGVPVVPVLFRGPFSRETVYALTDGKESLTGHASHIREGVVIRPTKERYIKVSECYLCGVVDHCTCRSERFSGVYGRVQLKNISGDYLTRKDGTEYN